MKYFKFIILTIIFTLLNGCKKQANTLTDKKSRQHFNFIICSDLSNRITKYNKPLSDEELINSFIDFYYPNIYKISSRITIGSMDEVQVLFLKNKNINDFNISVEALNLDFSQFNNKDRIKYLKGSLGDFQEEKNIFKKEIKKLYSSVKKSGVQAADTYSLFENKINEVISNKKNVRNILLLFTDGYIEYGTRKRKGNKTYYLSQALINEFRSEFNKVLKKELPDKDKMQAFFEEKKYGLVPVKNKKLTNLEVLALEFYDRQQTINEATINRPTDLEIINLFWDNWMKHSKVKKFVSCKVFTNEKNFKKNVIAFLKD